MRKAIQNLCISVMSFHSESSAYSIPLHCRDKTEDIRNIEATANKALKNIQSLYNEIMTPKAYPCFDSELSESDYSSDSSPSLRKTSSVNEKCPETRINNSQSPSVLCNSCQKYISNCFSCHNRNQHSISKTQHRERNVRSSSLELEPSIEYRNHVTGRSTGKNAQFNITVPRPFSITAENVKRQEAKVLKVAKLREELNKEIEKELNVKICIKPVPNHIYLPLYNNMVKRNEKRKEERKEKCLEILEKETKPFNLSATTKTNVSRSKSINDLTHGETKKSFKAKPVPKIILSENVSKRLKDKEEIRKILIAHRAEEMLKQSTLPFSPKHVSHSYSMLNLNCEKNNVKTPKPNIDAITKRLYTIKCKETMEDWNNKVLQSSKSNKKTCDLIQNRDTKVTNGYNTKSKLMPDYNLPFYNFPVRMSTAAALREKQIRAELTLRERREETDKMIREEMARKKKEILKNIWPRLKSVDPTIDSEKEIEEKVKSFKASQKSREQDYEKELEEMMKRVSKQFLLIERQSKEKKGSLHENVSESEEKTSEKDSSSEAETDSSEEIESPSRSEQSDV